MAEEYSIEVVTIQFDHDNPPALTEEGVARVLSLFLTALSEKRVACTTMLTHQGQQEDVLGMLTAAPGGPAPVGFQPVFRILPPGNSGSIYQGPGNLKNGLDREYTRVDDSLS